MNFKAISLLFILLFSIIGMSSAATLNIQLERNSPKILYIFGVAQDGNNTELSGIRGQNATFTPPYDTMYNYTHTGEYKYLRLCIGYGRLETGIDVYIKNLYNINTYPSDQQLNVSFSSLRDGVETAPDYEGKISWLTSRGYGILGLDNKLHQPDYCLPPYQQQ